MQIISGSWLSKSQNAQFTKIDNISSFSVSVSVGWSWYNKKEGIVSWNFVNNSYLESSVILFRNGYYFGNAYFPIYLENGLTTWATELKPLTDKGIENNSMPVAIMDFGMDKRIVAFIFTLSSGQKWSVLEGGFSEFMPPDRYALFDVTLEKSGIFCVGYDKNQVIDWDQQTGSNLKGFLPNPKSVQTLEFSVPTVAPFVKLFKDDSISDSYCQGQDSITSETNVSKDDIEDIVAGIIRRIRSI